MKDERGFWYLLTGLIIGISLGLLYGWVISPLQYTDTSPSSLRSDFKDQFRLMIASSYAATGNLSRAKARLTLLGDTNPVKALGDEAQRMLSTNASMDTIQTLARLAEALQTGASSQPNNPNPSPPQAISSSPSPDLPAGSSTPSGGLPSGDETLTPPLAPSSGIDTTPIATVPVPTDILFATPNLSPTPSPTALSPFTLAGQSTFCNADQPGLLEIYAKDQAGQGVPGVELVITWSGGEEQFFTGLKADINNGYADYVMASNVQYILSINNGATRVTGLAPPSCTASDGSSYPGGIRLDFQQK